MKNQLDKNLIRRIKKGEDIVCTSPEMEISIRKSYYKYHPRTVLKSGSSEIISVAVATYNGEKYIAEQLDSILVQLPENGEVIISDDGSTDRTVEIIKEYETKDKRVRLIKGPGKGIKQNIANAIKHSALKKPGYTGYLFLADQDDVWRPDKIKKMLGVFSYTNTDVVVHDAEVVGEDLDTVIMPSYHEYRNSKPGVINNLIKNRYMGCAMAIRYSAIEDILPIPDDIEMHDWWIGVRNDLHSKTSVFIDDKLIKYRRHEDNVSDFGRNSVPVMIGNRVRFLKRIWERDHRK